MSSILTEKLEMFRGDDFLFRFAFVEADEVTPIDITDWDFKLTLKLHPEMAADEAAISVDKDSEWVVDPENGVLFMMVPSAESVDLISTTYYWDLQREFQGIVTTVMRGKIKVHGDVTRRIG